MVQQVVPRRNGVEHLLHGFGRARFVFRTWWFSSCCRHRSSHLKLHPNLRRFFNLCRFCSTRQTYDCVNKKVG